MIQVQKFTFNPFQENTYLVFDEKKEALIIDPGCSNRSEQKLLLDYIHKNNLNPIKLLNTHAHIDHILGNAFIASQFELKLEGYRSKYPMLELAENSARMYQIPYDPSPELSVSLQEGDKIKFGDSHFEIIYVPGHSPDHIVFYNAEEKILIGGDVLFKGSIGRTDLPGGDHDTLINNIKEKIFTLEEETIVYSGHGPETKIGIEKEKNPFF